MNVIYNHKSTRGNRHALRNNATPQERTLWLRLRSRQLGYKFRRQHGIGKYIVDFYCPSLRLVIEIDGSQHYDDAALQYDAIRTNYFSSLSIRTLRFTNTDINRNIDGVVMRILEEIQSPPPAPPWQGGEEYLIKTN